MTIDPSARHDDPFGEAFSRSSQKAAQFVSMAASAYEIAVRRKALRAAKEAARKEQRRRELQQQERVAREAARARWSPAFDRRWQAQADLLQAGRVWGAAAPYADTDPEAASALRHAEERLRFLHPHAMAWYDRLRAEGADPLEAMRKAAPLFGRHPHARPGHSAVRPTIKAGTPGADTSPGPEETAVPGTPLTGFRPDPSLDAEMQALKIADRLQVRALAERGSRLTPDELATALETTTTLPAGVITRAARARGEENTAARAAGHVFTAALADPQPGGPTEARTSTVAEGTTGVQAPVGRTAVQLAAESFACTTADGIRAAVNGRLQQPASSQVRTATARNASRPGLTP